MSSMFEITKQDHLHWSLTLSSSSFETRNNDRGRKHRSARRTDRSGRNDGICSSTILLHCRKHNCHCRDHYHDRMLRSSSRYEISHPRSFHSSWRRTHLPSIQSRLSCSSRLHSPHGMCRIPLNTTNRSSTWIPSSVCMERCSSSCEPSPIPTRSFHRASRIQPYILPRIDGSSQIHRSFVGTRSSCEHGSPWMDRRMEWSCWWTDYGRHNLLLVWYNKNQLFRFYWLTLELILWAAIIFYPRTISSACSVFHENKILNRNRTYRFSSHIFKRLWYLPTS